MFGSPADFLVPAVYTAGSYIQAGLPNVTGTLGYTRGDADRTYTSSGAFTNSSQANGGTTGSAATTGRKFTLDASRSSAIYGNSDTVQPPAVSMRYYIKY